jgi:septal ring factor EnvC (AmiA/AmiB activator)
MLLIIQSKAFVDKLEDTIVELRNTISGLQTDLSATEDEVASTAAAGAEKAAECERLREEKNAVESALAAALSGADLRDKQVCDVTCG